MADMQSEIDASRKAKSDKLEKPKLQEPKFWTRYSPHHEFPLSAVTSFFAHVLALGGIGLVLTGFLGNLFGPGNRPSVPVEAITVAGGGGSTEGVGNARGDGIKPTGREAITQDQPKTPVTNTPSTKAAPLQAAVKQPPLPNEDVAPSTRFINDNDLALANAKLSDVGKQLDKNLSGILAGKGKGGPGSGGGEGKGVGTGKGDLSGEGIDNTTKREKRKNRWIMIFSTRSGNDYARQLSDLGAILAVRTDSPTDFMVYRDLTRRPVRGQIEDITNINRIFWIDDKRESIHSVCDVLGISPVPQQLVAFFPIELENELLQKELAHFRGGSEEDIFETYFKVELRGGKYTPIVRNVVRKGR